jgi:tetratricopeptide (TPR) repeat protein
MFKAVKKAETLKNDAGELFKAGKYAEANAVYSECLELFPANQQYNSSIYLNRAISNSKMKKLDESIKDLNEAIRLNEKYAKAFVKRAEIQ